MKRKGYFFNDLCGFGNLHAAFKKAWRGCGRSDDACRFFFHLETDLLQLKNELESGNYFPAAYRYFTIHDPKERLISVAPFRDRVVHHALVNVLEPVFEPTFIHDSYATRKGKGTHQAVRQAQRMLRKNRYYLKMDVARYFHCIDHSILLSFVSKKVKDKAVLAVVERIVRNADGCPGIADGKGLPIGNLTSQFFANVYLNPLDHFAKDDMGWAYIRYMDDMVLFSNSSKSLKTALRHTIEFLREKLGLHLKDQVTQIGTRGHGLPFLGYRIFPRLLRLKRVNLKRSIRRLDKKHRQYHEGIITEQSYVMSVRAVFDHVAFADTWRLRQSYLVPRAGAL